MNMHGVPLVERVIETVAREGLSVLGGSPRLDRPVPSPAEVTATLRMPGGRPLPPSLRRWLLFDAAWLSEIGWFTDPSAPILESLPLSVTLERMYAWGPDLRIWTEMFAQFEMLLPGACFPLIGGDESGRVLYVGEPDSTGEYPVLVTDIDDMPYVGVMYPGLDVYLAHQAGVIDLDGDIYTHLIDHPNYGARMREHAAHTGLGLEGAGW